MICANEFVWWDLKGNEHVYGIYFSSDLDNTFYSEIEKENLVQYQWAEGPQTQNEIPLFFTRSREMARFSIVQHNFKFSWSICIELSIFTETRLEIRQ